MRSWSSAIFLRSASSCVRCALALLISSTTAPSFVTASLSAALSFCRPRMRARMSSGAEAGQHDGLAVDALERRASPWWFVPSAAAIV